MSFLNKDGLVYLWDKIKTLVGTKADSNHSHSYNDLTDTPTIPSSLSAFGVTATNTELNYCDGVTSNIQTQLNNKASSSHGHSDKLPVSTSNNTYTTLADFWTHCESIFKKTNCLMMTGRAKLTDFTPSNGWFRYIVSAQNLVGNGSWSVTGLIILMSSGGMYLGMVEGGNKDTSNLKVTWTEVLTDNGDINGGTP